MAMDKVFRASTGYLSYPFFKNNCAIYPHQGGICPHMGTDYTQGREAEIISVLDGICIFSGIIMGDEYCGYGQMVVLEHDAPQGMRELSLFRRAVKAVFGSIVHFDKDKIRTIYCHLDSYHVLIDDIVEAGDVIGGMGDTGYGTVHLHWGLLLPTEPNERYVLTDGCGFADGYCVEGEPFLLRYYGEVPEYTGVVVEPKGMNVRACHSTSCDKVGELIEGANVVIMELVDEGGYTWGLLKKFENMDDEWVATARGDYPYIELKRFELPPIEPPIEPPIIEPPVDCDEAVAVAFMNGKKEGQDEVADAMLEALEPYIDK